MNHHEQQAAVERFIRACCLIGPGHKTPAPRLHGAYLAWAGCSGESPLDRSQFENALTAEGIRIQGLGTQRRYCEIFLNKWGNELLIQSRGKITNSEASRA
jgi:hypothetical protein